MVNISGKGKFIRVIKWLKRGEKGQSMVEFALALPMILFMLVGVVDFSRAYRYILQLNDAAFQGARTGSVPTVTDAAIRTAVRADLPSDVVLADSDIVISPSTRTTGSTITVTVSWQYTSIVPLTNLFLPSGVTIQGSGANTVR